MRFIFISTCILPWGGSEELWTEAALCLRQAGHQVAVFKTVLDPHARIEQLQEAGCQVAGLPQQLTVAQRLLNRILPGRWQWSPAARQQARLWRSLRQQQPHLVIVAQGSNFDGLWVADVCRGLGQPFVLLAQKAAEIFFPPPHQRELARLAYQAARHCYFVSHHNQAVTQHQLGLALPHASVVANPFNVPYAGELPWPAPASPPVRLACVARLEVLDKGQDILLQVLALPHWRQRPLHVSFFGRGGDEPALREMAALLGLEDRITWAGQVPDISAVWASHHALVLASRYEGLPLALAEAMLCGRPVIATAAGGTAELLADNETGFLAGAATVTALDEALERAWACQADWPALGRRAAVHARARLPAAPGEALARQLLEGLPY